MMSLVPQGRDVAAAFDLAPSEVTVWLFIERVLGACEHAGVVDAVPAHGLGSDRSTSATATKRSNVIHHTYSTYGSGVEQLMGTFGHLDVAPLGRNEEPSTRRAGGGLRMGPRLERSR
jgi:Bacterial protein of unknown function (DUF899)